MKRFLFIIAFLIIASHAYAQKLGSAPYTLSTLDSVLRQSVDTMYVFEIGPTSVHNNTSVIYVTKKDQLINIFEYGSDSKGNIKLPEGLMPFFRTKYIDISRARNNRKLDQFFRLKNVSAYEANKLWKAINDLKPFELIDDEVGGDGCDSSAVRNITKDIQEHIYVFDSYSLIFAAITKDSLKNYYFYAPKYFYNECPIKRESRGRILQIQKLLSKYGEYEDY